MRRLRCKRHIATFFTALHIACFMGSASVHDNHRPHRSALARSRRPARSHRSAGLKDLSAAALIPPTPVRACSTRRGMGRGHSSRRIRWRADASRRGQGRSAKPRRGWPLAAHFQRHNANLGRLRRLHRRGPDAQWRSGSVDRVGCGVSTVGWRHADCWARAHLPRRSSMPQTSWTAWPASTAWT